MCCNNIVTNEFYCFKRQIALCQQLEKNCFVFPLCKFSDISIHLFKETFDTGQVAVLHKRVESRKIITFLKREKIIVISVMNREFLEIKY